MNSFTYFDYNVAKIVPRNDCPIGHMKFRRMLCAPKRTFAESASLKFTRVKATSCYRDVRAYEKRENAQRLFKCRRIEARERKHSNNSLFE